MNTRALVAASLITLPAILGAQRRLGPPVGGQGASPLPSQPPKQIPAAQQQLDRMRSRWSNEDYVLVSSMQVPIAQGFTQRYTTYGIGTHAAYRFSEHFSGTIDVTGAMSGNPLHVSVTSSKALSASSEFGTRYRPLAPNHRLSPFVDLRGSYMFFASIFNPDGSNGSTAYTAGSQLTRGYGLFAGTGTDFALTPTLSLSTELSAQRNRLGVYRTIRMTDQPAAPIFYTSAYRFQIGVKYNPLRRQNLKQLKQPR